MIASDLKERLSRRLRNLRNSARLWRQQSGLTVYATFPIRETAVDLEAELWFTVQKLSKTPFCRAATLIDDRTTRIDGVPSNALKDLRQLLADCGADSLRVQGTL